MSIKGRLFMALTCWFLYVKDKKHIGRYTYRDELTGISIGFKVFNSLRDVEFAKLWLSTKEE